MGDVLNGYELTTPFQSQNAGFSRWTFAVRRGKNYFLKEFIDPVYPDEESLSPKLRTQRIEDCAEFVKKKKKLYTAISRAADGNLIPVFEFFRCDSHYYVSSVRVSEEKIPMEEIAKLPLEDRVLLCCTAAHSVMKLHEEHVVHADIKDSNVMLQRTATGKLCAKIIDLDCSFFEEDPPRTEEELGGDQVYLAPEACQLICGDPIDLTCKVDVFALGLLFHEYLTGEHPKYDKTQYDYAHEVVLDGNQLELSDELPCPLKTLLEQMLVCDPAERCGMREVFETLSQYLPGPEPVEAEPEPVEYDPEPEPMEYELEPEPAPAKPQDYFFAAGDL